MDTGLEKARQNEALARAAVEECQRAKKEAEARRAEARSELDEGEVTRHRIRASIDDLQTRLRSTREAIMPSEAAEKRARIELDATQQALAAACSEREAAEKALVAAEERRDTSEALLSEAQAQLENAGVQETSSRADLDEKVQRATDAQRAMDAAYAAVEDARALSESAMARWEQAKVEYEALPDDAEELQRQVKMREHALDQACSASKSWAKALEEERVRLDAAERVAARAREGYENAQANLRTAISAADRAEAAMVEAQQEAEIEQTDEAREAHARAVAAYASAGDVRSAAMTVNAQSLTRLADSDVEVIRIRIACDETSNSLDEANAAQARAERELREAREAIAQSNLRRKEHLDELQRKADEAEEARKNLEHFELLGQKAAEDNAAAQKGLRDVQNGAVLSGEETRVAADTLDERRHTLSEAVSAVEVARERLIKARREEEECAARVDATFAALDEATKVIQDAHAFIEDAQSRLEAQRDALQCAEKRAIELSAAYRRADEDLSNAQRELDVASSDLTDAEVAVIMAEIDSHIG